MSHQHQFTTPRVTYLGTPHATSVPQAMQTPREPHPAVATRSTPASRATQDVYLSRRGGFSSPAASR